MKLRVSCSAEDLSANDAYFAVLTVHEGAKGVKPVVLGQTEVLSTKSPDWTKTFYVDYELGRETYLVVSLCRGKNIAVGSTLFDIGQVLMGHAGSLAKELKSGSGIIAVHMEEVSGTTSGSQLHLHLRGLQLKNMDGLGFKLNVSDPFLELQRSRVTTTAKPVWDCVYRSVTLDNNLDPVFPEFFVDLEDLLGTKAASTVATAHDTKFRIAVYDWEKSGKHGMIGACVVTVNDLLDHVNDTALQDVAKMDLSKAFVLSDDTNKETGKILVFKANVVASDPPLGSAATDVTTDAPTTTTTPAVPDAAVDSNVTFATNKQAEEPTGAVAPATVPAEASAPVDTTAPPPADIHVEAEIAVATTTTTTTAAATSTDDDLEPVDAADLGRLRPTFCNYVAGGCQLRVVVAIDATASNGDPRQESSLHYFCDTGLNSYESALETICTVLAKYDSDQKYPVYGFGAKRDGVVDHCFSLSTNPSHEVEGVSGILQAYRDSFRSGIVMSSPRDFAPVIRAAGANAKKESGEGQSYTLLLIFTNGSPADSAATLAALKEVNDAPLSVTFVGVDKDEELVGTKALAVAHKDTGGGRDNVNYVHYQKGQDAESLAQGALHAIPAQLEAFFIGKEIFPVPPSDDLVVVPYSPDAEVHVPIQINEQTGEVTVGNDVKLPESKPSSAPSALSEIKKFGKKLKSNKTVGRITKHIDKKTVNLAKGKINRLIGKKLF